MKGSIKKQLKRVLALLLLSASVTLMAAGDSNDPLITRSYLEADYRAQMQALIQGKLNNAFTGAYNRSVSLINSITSVPVPREFDDVPPTAWYYPSVQYAVMHKITAGTGNNMFSPDSLITRGDFVTMLHKFAGFPSIKGKKSIVFTDVPLACYFDYPVKWASSERIVSGISSDKFDPYSTVTREQIAVILYNFQRYMGNSVAISRPDAWNSFSDKASVSFWAQTAIQWAISEKVMSGSDGMILPVKGATRAETVTLLYGFYKTAQMP
ncbi:MAG: S-layer homology domain-containing protein [Oscillospiraceae bacterium]|jgi:hypothetical protein|nr:S-layer homology domain-containing protein [Oscillospiraceae bacterium]